MNGSIRVLVADDHEIVRKGICALLDTVPDIEVVGEARDGWQAIAEAQRLLPDIILMDLVMPGTDGVEAIRRIRDFRPEVRVLVPTSFCGDDKLFPAIKAGAVGPPSGHRPQSASGHVAACSAWAGRRHPVRSRDGGSPLGGHRPQQWRDRHPVGH